MNYMDYLMEADRISRKVSGIAQAVLMVGMVVSRPTEIRHNTVMDLIVIGDMKDLGKAYKAVREGNVPTSQKNAEEGMIDTTYIRFQSEKCNVWMHYWTREAFDNVCNLEGWNWQFKTSPRLSRNEILRNAYGETIVMSHRVQTDAGIYIGAFPAYKNGSLFLGPQAMSLILRPKIVSDEGFVEEGLERLRKNLRREGENIECLLR